jgi:type I restriction enzyme S subunit
MIDGWQRTELGQHIDLLTGFPFKSSEYSDDENAIRLLRGDNIIQGSIRWEGVKRWVNTVDQKIQRYELIPGDFVIAMDRTWVKAGLKASLVTDADVPSFLVQRVARLRAKKSLETHFLPMLIRGHKFEQYVKGVQTETAVPHISPQQIKDFPVALPPLPEQKAIAELLSTWDEAIEKTERLIQAKEKRFKELLRELIAEPRKTQKGAKWENVKLEQVCKIASKEKLSSVDGHFLLTVKLHCLGIERNDRFAPTLTERGRPYYQHKSGDFLIGRQNFHNGGFGIIPPELDGGITSNAISCLIVNKSKLSKDFLWFQFANPSYYKKVGHVMDGTGQKELSDKQILKLKIYLPDLETQNQIAEILSSAQHEIVLLKQLADQYKTQKRGLMQRVLTGIWRMAPDAVMRYE